ncbi:hypothetical protein HDV03_004764 [Kappamyces sp. JEL0829]|nr:hypothetical protein HDV03_004754 [Kappamyces sp. JEL0829]KAJ3306634.1 hypothetical protein HDV03_004764 [Kappamyces sp. JEL0829]
MKPAPNTVERLHQEAPVDPNLTCSIAGREDRAALRDLINLAYTDAHWFKEPHFWDRIATIDSLDGYLADNGVFLLFTTKQEPRTLVACIYLSLPLDQSKPAGISLFSIHPSQQGRGLARKIFSFVLLLLGHIRTGSNRTLQLEVVSVQGHLFAIYEKWGFKRTGEILSWEQIGCSRKDVNQDCHLVVMHMSY